MKALVVYASLTGNTEEAADVLTESLEDLGVEVDMEDCLNVYGEDFLSYDICLVGTYTYGAEIPDDMADLYQELQTLDLTGKIFACFGSGDREYEAYCQSVDDFYDVLLKSGARPGGASVKVELGVDKEDILALEDLAKACVKASKDEA